MEALDIELALRIYRQVRKRLDSIALHARVATFFPGSTVTCCVIPAAGRRRHGARPREGPAGKKIRHGTLPLKREKTDGSVPDILDSNISWIYLNILSSSILA